MNVSWSKVDTRWYLSVNCMACSAPILFAIDYSNRELPPEPAGKLFLTCASAKCLHRADYTGAKISRFQKNPDMS
jgi:hypothetical protein